MSQLVDYFVYPHRRPGLDHDRFEHRYLRSLTPVAWPGGNRLLIWITIHVEHFPMDMPATPLLPLGGMDRVYPSVWDYSTRDYGNRIGIFRLMKVLDCHNLRATAAMNSEVAVRYPYLLEEVVRRGWEVAASGVDMGKLHYGLLESDAERTLVEQSFATLRQASGQSVTGWHSPGHSESANTPDLVAGAGARYIADWLNDDMPYTFSTNNGPLTHLPLSYDLSDRKIVFLHNQSISEYEQQIQAAFDCLYAESAERGGRILSLSLSPWVIAQPSRIKTLDRLLGRLLANDGVAGGTGEEICSAWTASGSGSKAKDS
jgi:peptidoglycan/xylan/chitin deacetylase (PgdA/CDA1 family)